MTVKPNLAFVIEEDGSFADTCERALQAVGLEVEKFSDGRTAYDRLAVEPTPRLVLVDLELAAVSGHEIVWEMWFNVTATKIIVIAPDTESAAIYQNKEGVEDVLIKPVPFDKLRHLLGRYLSAVR
jgi:DNA-binding NtrC family response regulator